MGDKGSQTKGMAPSTFGESTEVFKEKKKGKFLKIKKSKMEFIGPEFDVFWFAENPVGPKVEHFFFKGLLMILTLGQELAEQNYIQGEGLEFSKLSWVRTLDVISSKCHISNLIHYKI